MISDLAPSVTLYLDALLRRVHLRLCSAYPTMSPLYLAIRICPRPERKAAGSHWLSPYFCPDCDQGNKHSRRIPCNPSVLPISRFHRRRSLVHAMIDIPHTRGLQSCPSNLHNHRSRTSQTSLTYTRKQFQSPPLAHRGHNCRRSFQKPVRSRGVATQMQI